MDAALANFTQVDGDGNPTANGGHSTPPSPYTDSSSTPAALSASASTLTTDLISLPSEASKPSLETVKRSSLGEPPTVTWPYSHTSALDDIPGIAYALDLFLKSLMVESEEYCHTSDPKKCVATHLHLSLLFAETGARHRERLYFATGFGLIQCVKALMSFEDDVRDLSRIGSSRC
jgi:hypothetical protein